MPLPGDGGVSEEALQRQAQQMAEKALAALPEGTRAAKMEAVKQGILRQLRCQSSSPSASARLLAAPPRCSA